MNSIDISSLLLLAATGIVTAIFTGKFIRRLVLLPFEYLASRTSTTIDDKLLQEAEKDLGIDSPTLPADKKEE